jgi:hypothetical protein
MDPLSRRFLNQPDLPSILRPPSGDLVSAAFRPKKPVFSRSQVDVQQIDGALGQLAEIYPITSISALDSSLDFFHCWEVTLDEGVKLGLMFKDPVSQEIGCRQRFLNLQFIVRQTGSKANGIAALRRFLRVLESLPDNPVQLVYYRYGDIRADLIGERDLETVAALRLDRVYERLFRRKPIGGTEYYALDYQPRFPRADSAI